MRIFEQPATKKRAFNDNELRKMAEDKNTDEVIKKHMRHKPYKCDFGGGKNGKENQL